MSYNTSAIGTQSKAFGPAPGQVIEIRCTVPSPASEMPLFFRGRVVRTGAGSIGVSFVEPSPEALNALHDFATRPASGVGSEAPALDSRTVARSDPPGGVARPAFLKGIASAHVGNGVAGALGLEGKAERSILFACKQRAGRVTRPLAEAFLEQAGDRLLSAVERTQALRERNAFYHASNMLTKQGDAFKGDFEAAMHARLNRPPSPAFQSPDRDGTVFSATTLSLVEPDEFEDWLAFSDIARQAELQFQEQLGALEQRLALLFKVPIDKPNNPFGPASFCQAFQDALTGLQWERAALPTVYAVFEDVLCANSVDGALIGNLYHELNQYLAEKGVLPKLTDLYRIRSGSTRASDAPPPSGNGGRPTSFASGADAHGAQGVRTDGVAPDGRFGAAATSATEDWYRLVQNLDSLRQQVSQPASYRPHVAQFARQGLRTSAVRAGGTVLPEQQSQPEFYSPEELLSALSRLHSAPSTQLPAEGRAQGVKFQLLSTLANAGGSNSPSASRRFSMSRELFSIPCLRIGRWRAM